MAMRPIHFYKSTFTFIILLACSLAQSEDQQDFITTSEPMMIPLIEKEMTANFALPVRGDNKSTVEGEFGPPFNIHKAKGNPPISRWDYEQFSVYFESGMVIHSVLKR